MSRVVTIAELGRFADFRPYVAAIDDAGVVAFQAALPGGGSGVFTSDGRGVSSANTDLAGVISHPAVDGDGGLWFYAELAGGARALVSARDGDIDVIAATGDELADIGPLGPTVNAGGVVGYRARDSAGLDAVFAPERVAETGGELAGFEGLPVVTPGGAVVYRATRADGSEFVARDGEVVADTRAGFRELGRFPAAIDDDTVVFTGTLASGVAGVFAIHGGAITTVADADAGFASFRGALIDGSGRVVFYATPVGGELGIYVGSDPARDRVLGIGDGGVTAFALNPVSINRHGQLAVRLELDGGGQAIVRVDPD